MYVSFPFGMDAWMAGRGDGVDEGVGTTELDWIGMET